MFDIGALANLDDEAYDALQPVRWPLRAGGIGEGGRLFAQGGFATGDGRARMVGIAWRGRPETGSRRLLLNTGRVRDQWHTMTRTGLAPNLMTHTPEPLLAMHPADAAEAGIEDGGSRALPPNRATFCCGRKLNIPNAGVKCSRRCTGPICSAQPVRWPAWLARDAIRFPGNRR